MIPKIIIHGGFFSESGTNAKVKLAKQNALKDVVAKAYQYLQTHTATETCVYAVSLLEDDDLFNAGLGSQIQSDGKIRLSCALMDGNTQKFSGLINIQDVKNPIKIAEKLLTYDDRVLSDNGALDFARKNGFEYASPEIPQRRKEYQQKLAATAGLGTVGCVALDIDGNIAAATSTGGKGFEIPCRVSDSATTAGNYANKYAGISCTGIGEDIVSASLASKIVTRVTDGFSLKDACDKTFTEFKEIDGFAGVIGIDHKGNIYHTDSYPYMVYALYDDGVNVFE
jgi:L-asparaginase